MLSQVVSILILDAEGNRLAVKYMPFCEVSSSAGNVTMLSSGPAKVGSHPTTSGMARMKAGASSGGGTGDSAVVLENGERCLKDYTSQTKFESQLTTKATRLTGRTEVEILMIDRYVALFRSINDISLYVVGDSDANELMLLDVANAVYQGLSNITSGQVGKRQVLEHLDSVFLMLDEVVDGGVILETDAGVITSRLNMTGGNSSSGPTGAEGGGPETTAFNQAITHAKENLMRSFLSSSS
eukprot:GHVS01074165.1.p1 GENE.GHVS01074165.1~~GHVS01074165.1.p1  ORF type:complete len:241 (+),score=55.68 GHVS01074165.1:127-849(+)